MSEHNGRAAAPSRPVGVPGRRFVLAAIAAIVLIVLLLAGAFVAWRDAYVRRAEFGRSQLRTALDPLRPLVPPGVDPAEWADAIRSTDDMLAEVAGTGLLDRAEAIALRSDIDVHVAGATPETSLGALARIWVDMGKLKGRFRPKLLRGRPALLERPEPTAADPSP